MKKFNHFKLILSAATLVLVLIFLPNILFCLNQLGLFSGVNTKNSLGVDVTVSHGWFPIASNESFLGKYFFKTGKRVEVTFMKNSWIKSWRSDFIIVSKLNGADSKPRCKTEGLNEMSLYLPENESTSSISKVHNTYVLYVPKLDLSFATDNPDSFKAIKYIHCNPSLL